MYKRGFVHLIPLVIIAVVIIGGFSALSTLSEQRKREAVGKVLSQSSSNDDEDRSGSSGSSGSGEGKTGQSNSPTLNTSTEKTKIESNTGTAKTKIETNKNKTKIGVKSLEGKFKTKTEEDKQETKIETRGLKIEIKIENGLRIVKIKNEHDEEVKASPEAENELLEDANEKLEEEDIQIASGSAGLGFVHHGKKVRTNFPLTIDPATGELYVTTPAGTKIVAILPDVAIQNMLRAGILTHVGPTPSPSPSPPESTASAPATPSATVAGAAIELTEVNDQPVYLISGIRQQNFLGIVPVDIRIKAVVSVQNGQLVDVQQGILARILDILSF